MIENKILQIKIIFKKYLEMHKQVKRIFQSDFYYKNIK